MRTLDCGALRLVPQSASHAPALYALLLEPRLYRFEGEPPRSLDWLRDRLERLSARRSPDGREQWLNWVVERDAELLGYVQATVFEGLDGRRTAWVAYVLGPAHWGQGLAARALQRMEQELLGPCAVQRLAAVFKRANQGSWRLLRRQGYRRVPRGDALWQAAGPTESVWAKGG